MHSSITLPARTSLTLTGAATQPLASRSMSHTSYAARVPPSCPTSSRAPVSLTAMHDTAVVGRRGRAASSSAAAATSHGASEAAAARRT